MVPIQERKAEFSSFFPRRRNGWQEHALIFNRNVEQTCRCKDKIFEHCELDGAVKVLRDGFFLRLEFWWKGRAPWGYHNIMIVRNLVFDANGDASSPNTICGLEPEVCQREHSREGLVSEKSCSKAGFWSSSQGHVVVMTRSQVGDKYSAINWPAHIQGTPACFEFRVSAFKPLDDITLSNESPQNPVSWSSADRHIRDGCTPDDIQELLHRDVNADMLRHQTCQNGSTLKESLLASTGGAFYVDKHAAVDGLKSCLCINAASHAPPVREPSLDSSLTSANVMEQQTCWSCKASLSDAGCAREDSAKMRIQQEDEASYGADIMSNETTYERASIAAFHRGVCVKWLETFTNMHDCWDWPTWRVVQNIIKPATDGSRLRYVHLPGISTAAKVGPVDVFISHSWGGIWGDLVAAALSCVQDDDRTTGSSDVTGAGAGDLSSAHDDRNEWLPHASKTVRVYIDVFAVRQWPGNLSDIVFGGVVKRCKTVMVVVSSGELERIGELNFKLLMEQGHEILLPNERRGIPFLRIWCLAEIASACNQQKPLVIACGRYALDSSRQQRYVFQSNTPLLYHMQVCPSPRLSFIDVVAVSFNISPTILAQISSFFIFPCVVRFAAVLFLYFSSFWCPLNLQWPNTKKIASAYFRKCGREWASTKSIDE